MGSPLPLRALLSHADEYGAAVRNAMPKKVIVAYHGSPHSFDAFDASKIGTGEGAQAYGHGLYFAGNERVARAYRDNIPAVPSGPTAQALQELSSRLLPLELEGARIRDAMDDAAELRGELSPGWGNIRGVPPDVLRELGPRLQRVNDEINKLRMQEQQIRQGLRGHMYEVEIDYPEEALLDWDAPLESQPQAVRDFYGSGGRRGYHGMIDGPGDGDRLWHNRKLSIGPNSAAKELFGYGIPGIRYLDRGSRAAGEGTRNFVMFPGTEDRIRILRKYGVLAPVAAAAGTNSEEP